MKVNLGSDVYLELMLHSTSVFPFTLFDVDAPEKFVFAVDVIVTHANSVESPHADSSRAFVIVEGEDTHNVNVPFGLKFHDGRFLMFSFFLKHIRSCKFLLRAAMMEKGDPPTWRQLCAFFSGHQLTVGSGTLNSTLVDSSQEVQGGVSMDYLVVLPWVSLSNYLGVSQPGSRYFRAGKTAHIGHRGCGSSTSSSPSMYEENTIPSFLVAMESGADYIELDVQLTRDHALVVYHDYYIGLPLNSDSAYSRQVNVPLRDLTLDQIRHYKLCHAPTAEVDRGGPISEVVQWSNAVCPTLQEVLQSLPLDVGINIEVKYPLQEQNGQWELEGGYFDRNLIVDLLLEVVLSNAGTRRIIFSSFDPGICIMLKQKQPFYSLLFLTCGETRDYPPYMDARCRSVEAAMDFALRENLSGVCAYSNPILTKIQALVKEFHASSLLFFTWGSANNTPESISSQEEARVNGIIYDRIYDIKAASSLQPRS